jgi:serine/threonine protein phosphatase PrpC
VAILMVNNKAIICNVGDSRCYSIRKTIKQLSRDHTQIEKLIRENQISREDAANDPRSSILTQCIGVSPNVNPDFFQIVTEEGMGFLLCSDGFRHKIKEEEIKGILQPSILFDESSMKTTLIDLTDLNKQRGETDNITSVFIKII